MSAITTGVTELAKVSDSPRDRMRALTAAGCFRQWQPAKNDEGYYNDSHYLFWVVAEQIIAAWGFTDDECDQAWQNFLIRHKENYPGGNWQPAEKAYLNLLERPVTADDLRNALAVARLRIKVEETK